MIINLSRIIHKQTLNLEIGCYGNLLTLISADNKLPFGVLGYTAFCFKLGFVISRPHEITHVI